MLRPVSLRAARGFAAGCSAGHDADEGASLSGSLVAGSAAGSAAGSDPVCNMRRRFPSPYGSDADGDGSEEEGDGSDEEDDGSEDDGVGSEEEADGEGSGAVDRETARKPRATQEVVSADIAISISSPSMR